MSSINYNIFLTGDCSNNSTGGFSVFFDGGVTPYTVQFVSPITNVYTNVESFVTLTNLQSGTYIARVNDGNVDVNQEFYLNIFVSSGLCASVVSVQPTTCNSNNGSVIVTSTSSYASTSFILYDSGDTYVFSATPASNQYEFFDLSAGTYYAVAQDAGGCTAKTQSFIVEDSTTFDYGLYVVPNSSCGSFPMGKIFVTGLTGTPPFEYLWSNGQTGDTVTGLTSGFYSVQVTDGYGCQLTETGEIVDVDSIGLGYFSAITPTCFSNNGQITLNITGGTEPYFYSASTGEFVISYSKSFTITDLYAGQYNFLVKDAALCTLEVGVPLSSPTGIDKVDVITNNSTCSSSDGEIQIVVYGGAAPYTYTLINSGGTTNISDSSLTYTFTGLTSGNYNVSVQDANGCGFSQDVTVLTTNKFIIETSSTGTTCNLNNGVVKVNVFSGFTTPLNYSIDGSQSFLNTVLTSVTFNNLSYGEHEISVTDFTGCEQKKIVYVVGSPPLTFSLNPTSCVNGDDGTITAFISSGLPPFTFNWSTNVPSNPQNIFVEGLTAGTYSLNITDSNGCTLTETVDITCNQLFSTYQTYVMGEEPLIIDPPGKTGMLEMLNDGFVSLTSGNTNPQLVLASFTAFVAVNPLGLTTSNTFYYTTSLQNVPTDDLWFLTMKTILYSIPGVGGVSIDTNTNKLTVQTLPESNILSGQELIVEMKINYDIISTS